MPSIPYDDDLDDYNDDALIREIESRGWIVSKDGTPPVNIEEVVWRYKNGYIEEALIQLERVCPELYGISKHVKKDR